MRTCFFVILSLSLLATWFMPFEKDGDSGVPVVLARHQPAPDPAVYEAGFQLSLAPTVAPSRGSPTSSASPGAYVPAYQAGRAGPDSTGRRLMEMRQKELDDLFAVMREPGV